MRRGACGSIARLREIVQSKPNMAARNYLKHFHRRRREKNKGKINNTSQLHLIYSTGRNKHGRLEDLEDYIDESFQRVVMGKPKQPAATPSSKRSRPEDSPGAASSSDGEFMEILTSINAKLDTFDARLSLVEILHKEFQALRESLEYSQQQVSQLAEENNTLKGSVKTLTEETRRLREENSHIKDTVLDLQARSMRDNLVFSGIPENNEENTEATIKNFILKNLKLPADTVNNISFHRAHRLGGRRQEGQRPRPIVVKFVHFKQKELVKGRGRELRGTDFSVNDQFPKEILERRRRLFPVRRKFIDGGSRAVIAVDKLYVNGQLYRDKEVTPWLY